MLYYVVLGQGTIFKNMLFVRKIRSKWIRISDGGVYSSFHHVTKSGSVYSSFHHVTRAGSVYSSFHHVTRAGSV